jgi:hypothetical protein
MQTPSIVNVTVLSHVWRDHRRSFGLNIGFIDHFKTQLVITLNCSSIANSHVLQFTRVHAQSFPDCGVFTRHFLVTASNNGYSAASDLKFFLNGGSLPN